MTTVPITGTLRQARPQDRLPTRLLYAAGALTIGLALAEQWLPWAAQYPDGWVLRVDRVLTAAVTWLIDEAGFGPFTFKDLMRAIGAILDAPVNLLEGLLATGFGGRGSDNPAVPPLSWIGVLAVFVATAATLGDRRLTLFVGLAFTYVAAIGLWESTMQTLASIVVAVLIGVASGVLLGVASYRVRWIDRLLAPALDFMQTVPVFAYLVPALILFGYGPSAALVVTLIYAMPPMARVTRLALSQVAPEIVEFGRMAGCGRSQLMWKVLIPAARPRLMIGLNQVIMLSLNMVIIASMIGAGGLGYDVWQALKALRIGQGVEAGVAITVIAIVLDRLSQRFALRRPRHESRAQTWWRHRLLLAGLAFAVATTIASYWLPFFAAVPSDMTISTGRLWDGAVAWVNVNLGDAIGAVKDAFFVYLLKPVKGFMLSLPWLGVVLMIAAVGFRLGGARLALRSAALIAFIAVIGLWEPAMVSVYLVGVCVLIASPLGILIGIASALDDRLHRVVQIVIDTLQTLPSFVYLIPVIMLFGVGDFSAMIAVSLYAIVPAIRYTDHGIRQVSDGLVEASRAMGCTPLQILRRVQLPLAVPDIMLGINQTLMMGLSMLVITALVGTRDLGQETLIALSKVDPGRGIAAGICVAFIAIAADRIINAWAMEKRRRLGLGLGGGEAGW